MESGPSSPARPRASASPSRAGLRKQALRLSSTGAANSRPRLRGRLVRAAPRANVEAVAAHLGAAAGVEGFIKRVGDADILVNNLGIFEPKPFVEITDADWQRFLEINVMSGVPLSRHYLPGMVKRDWGRIVFISSESGLNNPGEMIHHGMSKDAHLA